MRKFASLFLFIFLCSFVQPVYAEGAVTDVNLCAVKIFGYTTERLTNVGSAQFAGKYPLFSLEHGGAAWQETASGKLYGQIVYYNGSSKKILSQTGRLLDAAGINKVVWAEKRPGTQFTNDLFYFDGTTVKQLTFPNSDVQNSGAQIDVSGNIVWVNSVSDQNDATVSYLNGTTRVMYFNGSTTKAISDFGPIFVNPQFSSDGVVWIGVNNNDLVPNKDVTKNIQMKNVMQWNSGVLTQTTLPEVTSGEKLSGSFVYSVTPNTPATIYNSIGISVGNGGIINQYNWKTGEKKVIGSFGVNSAGLDIGNDIAKDSVYGWENLYSVPNPGSTAKSGTSTVSYAPVVWNGADAKDLSNLLTPEHNYLKFSDISPDGSVMLIALRQTSGTTMDNATNKNQIYLYSVQNNTSTQFTNTPTTNAFRTSGASAGYFGTQGDIFWIVNTPESDFTSNDICHATLTAASAPAPSLIVVPMQPTPTPIPVPEQSPSSDNSQSPEMTRKEKTILDPSNYTELLSTLGVESNPTDFAKYKSVAVSDATAIGITLSTAQQSAIANFDTYGASAETVKLGSGERRALIKDYFETVGRAEVSWEDVQRLTTGQKPVGRNLVKEQALAGVALKDFIKMTGHAPDFTNPSEDLAWNTMLYRVRFPRDLVAEQFGISQYQKIFHRSPSSSLDWAEVRALGYALK